jgi:CRP-like cAMP-binding protein
VAILTGGPRTATVIAESTTELYYLERDEVMELMHQIPDIAINLARVMCERLRRADQEIRQVLLNPL